MVKPTVGQVWRSNDGGHWFAVVAVDERWVYIKRADFSKKDLANVAGSSEVPLSEWDSWHLRPESSPANSGAT